LAEKKMDAMVVTALDEVAWLFNLRGSDIPYTPVFTAYAIIDSKKAILYIHPEKQTFTVKKHLRSQVGLQFSSCTKVHNCFSDNFPVRSTAHAKMSTKIDFEKF
jgi:hypothetical protein